MNHEHQIGLIKANLQESKSGLGKLCLAARARNAASRRAGELRALQSNGRLEPIDGVSGHLLPCSHGNPLLRRTPTGAHLDANGRIKPAQGPDGRTLNSRARRAVYW